MGLGLTGTGNILDDRLAKTYRIIGARVFRSTSGKDDQQIQVATNCDCNVHRKNGKKV